MDLNQVTVGCSDVARSISFYELLGLKLIVHTHDRYARFECPNGESTFSLQWYDHVVPGTTKVYFEVEDLNSVYERLVDHGFDFTSEPTDQPWLWKEASLLDPDGNPIILFSAGKNRKAPPWKKTN